MSYIGNTNTTQAFTPAIDYFSGNGSTTAFTLSRPVASVAQVEAVIDNVVQNPSSAYTISGSTITFTSAPLAGTNNIYVRYTSPITQVIAPGQGTVNTTALGNITNIASGNSSLTLQTGSGNTTAVTIDTSQNLQFNSGFGSVATAYGCRAWVNFNGSGTVAIRASGNVSSITDNGTGDYTINFSNAMPDANYTLTASAGRGSGGTDPRAVGLNQANPTTSAARITVKFVDGSAGLSDVEYVCCSIFR